MKLFKKVFYFLFWTGTLCVICMSIFVLCTDIHAYMHNGEVDKWENYIDLQDDYDSETGSVMDFLSLSTSFDSLFDTYERLKKNKKIDYREIMFQNIELMGNYSGDEKTIDGGNELRNQEINGGMFTPLKSMQVSEKDVVDMSLSDFTEGKYIFEQGDYFVDSGKKIPVVLGASYKKNFDINDEFRGMYLSRSFRFVVKDFFREGAKLDIAGKKMKLDSYIIFPALNVTSKAGQNNLFYKVLYLQKIEGFIKCGSKDEYKTSVEEIKKISDITGFKYEKRLLDMYQEVKTERIFLLLVIILFILILQIVMIKKYKRRKE